MARPKVQYNATQKAYKEQVKRLKQGIRYQQSVGNKVEIPEFKPLSEVTPKDVKELRKIQPKQLVVGELEFDWNTQQWYDTETGETFKRRGKRKATQEDYNNMPVYEEIMEQKIAENNKEFYKPFVDNFLLEARRPKWANSSNGYGLYNIFRDWVKGLTEEYGITAVGQMIALSQEAGVTYNYEDTFNLSVMMKYLEQVSMFLPMTDEYRQALGNFYDAIEEQGGWVVPE